LLPTTHIWRPVEVALTYRLGEIKIFKKVFEGFANREHFTRITPYRNFPAPEEESAPESDFYFYPAYPVAFDPVRIDRKGDWLIYTPHVFNNYYVDFRAIGDFEAYLKQFSSKSRSTLLRKVRKFEAASDGPPRWRIFRTPSEMEEFFSLALPLSEATYQSRLLDSGLPRSKAFIDRAKETAAQGDARGFLLFIKDKPVAYVFCYSRTGIVTYDYVGFDSSESSLSPGTVLQYLILRELFSDPNCFIFDFTEGEGAQKQFFGTTSQRCAKSYFVRRTLMNEFLIRAHMALNSFVESVGAYLDRLGIKAKVRRLIRRAS